MSFSGDVKEELARQCGKSRHCQIAELAGIFFMEGMISRNPLSIRIQSENALLQEKYAFLLKSAFDVDTPEAVSAGDACRVLGALRLLGEDEDVLICGNAAGRCCNGLLLQKTCCKRAFIRGAFMAAGSISDPRKSYHFEIACRSPEQAVQLQGLMADFDMDARIVERKSYYVLYLKEGAQIVDMLNVMEAYVSLMNLENLRIVKEMRNSVNRRVNCETANISKTINAAVRQAEDIRLIRDTIGLDRLSPALREMALVRLEYPDASLRELGELLEPPVGRSGVNHRLRKLGEIADKLRLSDNGRGMEHPEQEGFPV